MAAGFAAGYLDSYDFGSSASDFSYTYSNPFAYDPFDPFSYQSRFLTTFDIYGHNYAPVRAPQMPTFGLLPIDYYAGSPGNSYDWIRNSNPYSYSDYGGGFDSSTRTEFGSDRSVMFISAGLPFATIPIGHSDYRYFEHMTMYQNGITPIGGEPDNFALMAGLGGFGRVGYAAWQSMSVSAQYITGTSFAFSQVIAEPDQPLNYVGLGPVSKAKYLSRVDNFAPSTKGAGSSFSGIANKGDKFVDVYRAFGDDARAQGFSWTTRDPRTVSNFRDAAGLPSGGLSGANNSADFLIQGRARVQDVIKFKSADPLDGNIGGLPELIIDPKNVKITDFSVLKP